MKRTLPVWNLDDARFSCVWPSCGGACCKESRPPVSPGEIEVISRIAPRAADRVRPEARAIVRTGAWLTKRTKGGRPTLAISRKYCVFYNEGCVLHVLGAEEGDKNRYKPATCITFPLDPSEHGGWYVRQHGVEREAWDLGCLDPLASSRGAAESLEEELAFAERVEAGLERWRR